jgi:hypothetical protein
LVLIRACHRMLTRSVTKHLPRVEYAGHTLHASTKPRQRCVQYGKGRPHKSKTTRKRRFDWVARHRRTTRHAVAALVTIGRSRIAGGGKGLYAKTAIPAGNEITRFDGLRVDCFVGSDRLEDSFGTLGSPEYIVGQGHTVGTSHCVIYHCYITQHDT